MRMAMRAIEAGLSPVYGGLGGTELPKRDRQRTECFARHAAGVDAAEYTSCRVDTSSQGAAGVGNEGRVSLKTRPTPGSRWEAA